LFEILVMVILAAVVWRQHRRLRDIETDLRTLRQVLDLPRKEPVAAAATPVEGAAAAKPEATPGARAPVREQHLQEPTEPFFRSEEAQHAAAVESRPWGSAVAGERASTAAAAPGKPDIETALGTRWAVWVGGLALALGGIFLVRYSIEAGIFGPRVRLLLASMLGVLVVVGGEFVRRTRRGVQFAGSNSAHVPGILTAAGAFTLFGVAYAAHGIYGFIGPTTAFVIMGAIGLAIIAAALVHGQALAGLGLLGSFVTPVLVASQSPNVWALFNFLVVVLATTSVIARLRAWWLLMAGAFAGTGLWCLLYLTNVQAPSLTATAFINMVMLAVLAFIWLRAEEPAAYGDGMLAGVDRASVVPATLIALSAVKLGIDETIAGVGGVHVAALLAATLVLVALYRHLAIALLYAGGAATLAIYLHAASGGAFDIMLWPGRGLYLRSVSSGTASSALVPLGLGLGLLFLLLGLWMARSFAANSPGRAASWAGWAVLVACTITGATWFAFGNLDRDYGYAFAGGVLCAALIAGGEMLARAERPELTGGLAVSFMLAGAAAALVFVLQAAFGPGMTTILTGAAVALPAFASRYRQYPILGWLCVAVSAVVVARIALDPSIVGINGLGRTPVFNALLPGYGIPALASNYAAWQLRGTTNGRPRLVMEAVASLLVLLTLAMLVRHAMNGGVIAGGAPSLAEQAIYTLIAIGAAAVLIALDTRSPSPVFRFGSIAAGIGSALLIAGQHLANLNPVATNESTGAIPVFNLLLLAYLLPAIGMAALALYARQKRPREYIVMLALIAAALAFSYVTLSIRRIFHGEFIGLWKGLGQWETYTYSAAWLALGVALLVAGLRVDSRVLRLASAGLVVLAVAKVFLFDMAELEGVLRAVSFIGLGAVLIGIGLFYQRTLSAELR
jgi:uncharacterized membrane protein